MTTKLPLQLKKGVATFPCPICGTKVLKTSGYCMKCKKKVTEDE